MGIRFGWIVAFVSVALAVTFAWSSLRGTRPVKLSNRLQPVSDVPAFHLTDQTGQPFGLDDLKGKIWVANFVFTRCLGPCPLLSSRMAELNQKIGRAGKGVELVTFSIDPAFDTPDVLAAYSKKLGAGSDRWKFLTGDPAAVQSLVVQGLLQPLAKEPDGTPAHSTRFVLVDRDGRLRGFEDGNDPEVVQKLLMDMGDLIRENPLP